MNTILIIGSGISGLSAADFLGSLGNNVVILEKEGSIGGKILSYCCKATDSCSRCGVCTAHEKLADTLKKKNVRIITGTDIKSVTNTGEKITIKAERKNPYIDQQKCLDCGACAEACPENCISVYRRGDAVQYIVDYSKCRLHKGQECDVCMKTCPADAIEGKAAVKPLTLTGSDAFIATGHTVFDAAKKPRYGYGRMPNVITGLELEEMLSRELDFPEDVSDVAFIQCVGSRDPVLGRNYCSSVCCAYALRMARVLKYRKPDIKVTVYYIDLQAFDKTFTRFKEELLSLGVQLIRGVPFRVDELESGKLRCMVEHGNGDETIAEHDKVVLSVGMGPDLSSGEVAELFGLKQDEYGFLSSEKSNVYVSGTCENPQSITESIASAEAAAVKIGEKE